ncbi:MAG: 3'-5' exonuclease [Kineosporiaceae bacterium]
MSVVFHRDFARNLERLDRGVKAKAWDFVTKLSAEPDGTGLDLKLPASPADRRVRTARVNDQYRAVLFVVGDGRGPDYVLATILNHDDAYDFASSVVMQVNAGSGAVELITQDAASPQRVPSPGLTSGAGEGAREEAHAAQQCLPFEVAELISLGIDAPTAVAAVQVHDEAALLALLGDLPAWQSAALLDLATGRSLDDVRNDYAITPVAAEHVDAPETLRDALARPSSQMEFATLADDDLQAMINGEFAAWRVYLHPRQRAHAYRDRYNGPARITGGPGTGKTVVALHRAAHLARRSAVHGDVLLVTYNRTLAAQLKADLYRLAGAVAERVHVLGVDQLARAVVVKGGGAARAFLGDRDIAALWAEALDSARVDVPDLTPTFLNDEYVDVVLAQGVADEAAYLKVARRGRSRRLNRAQRAAVWRVIETYRALLRERGATTFADLAATAADLVSADPGNFAGYRHAVVDEGQDLHAAHWRLLRALVPPGPDDIFICEDSHQRIYGRKVVLSRLGIETRGRSRRLTLNYRTTERILGFSLRVLGGLAVTDLDGEDDPVTGYVSLRTGFPPVTRSFDRRDAEWAHVVAQVGAWLEAGAHAPGEIGVLTRRARDASALADLLRREGIPARLVTGANDTAGAETVLVMTMHRAKGAEFSRCVVAVVGASVVPEPSALRDLDEDEHADALARERFLLYVACTRARDELVITWTGAPSPFLVGR